MLAVWETPGQQKFCCRRNRKDLKEEKKAHLNEALINNENQKDEEEEDEYT